MKRFLIPAVCAAFVAGCEPGGRLDAQVVSGTNAAPVASAATNSPAAGTNSTAVVAVPAVPALPGPVADVVQLNRRGLGDGVVNDFIETIREPFTLSADQVIYLNDLGVSQPVIQALLKKAHTNAPTGGPTQTVIVQNAQPSRLNDDHDPAAPTAVAVQATNQNVILNPYLTSTAPAAGPAGQPVAAQGADVGSAPGAPGGVAAVAAPTQQVVVNQQVFYESLAPYGSWVEVPNYGWCWRPTVAVANSNWLPYSDGGRWLWTDAGWYWHSTYTWGWAPYHYGRWHRHARFGWVWYPGYDWAPAWVAWRSTSDYCGWAPLPPECRWTSGIGFSWVNGRTSVGIGFGIGSDWWFATSWNRFCDPVLPAACLPRHRVGRFVNDSRITVGSGQVVNIRGNNNTVIINNGISRDEVQRHTREEIRRTDLRDTSSPAAAQSLASARPNPSASRPTEVAVYRPSIPAHSSRPPESVLGRQEVARIPSPAPASSFSGTSSSRPMPVPSAAGSLNTARPASSSRPAPVSSSGVSRPTPITGLSSTRPAPASSTAISSPSSSYSAPEPSRSEVIRSPSVNDSFGRPQPVATPAPSISTPSPSTGISRPSPAANFYNKPATPAPSQNAAPAPVAKPNFNTYSKPAPVQNYQAPANTPPARTEAVRPAPSYSAPAQAPSAPASRPAPSYSPPSKPAPTQSQGSQGSQGSRPNPKGR
jgi:hypothetical protein